MGNRQRARRHHSRAYKPTVYAARWTTRLHRPRREACPALGVTLLNAKGWGVPGSPVSFSNTAWAVRVPLPQRVWLAVAQGRRRTKSPSLARMRTGVPSGKEPRQSGDVVVGQPNTAVADVPPDRRRVVGAMQPNDGVRTCEGAEHRRAAAQAIGKRTVGAERCHTGQLVGTTTHVQPVEASVCQSAPPDCARGFGRQAGTVVGSLSHWGSRRSSGWGDVCDVLLRSSRSLGRGQRTDGH